MYVRLIRSLFYLLLHLLPPGAPLERRPPLPDVRSPHAGFLRAAGARKCHQGEKHRCTLAALLLVGFAHQMVVSSTIEATAAESSVRPAPFGFRSAGGFRADKGSAPTGESFE